MPNVINGTSTGSGGLITSGDDSGILNIQTNETTAMSIDASQSVDFTNNIDAPNTFGFKNRVINGGMTVAQRGTSLTNPNGYTLDRYNFGNGSATTVVQQSTNVPSGSGFSYSLFANQGATTWAPTGYQWQGVSQAIEGYNFADMMFGTASAKSFTVSFWVYASQTGTYNFACCNASQSDLGSATVTRSYVTTYTVNTANTWQYVTITVPGDTSGTWIGATNASAIAVFFNLGSGSSYNTATTNAWQTGKFAQTAGAVSQSAVANSTFYITGVQLEKGTQATSFDFRSYGTELGLCQRYFTSSTGGSYLGALCFSTNRVLSGVAYSAPPMRAVPTVTVPATAFTFFTAGVAQTSTAIGTSAYISGYVTLDVTVTATTGASGVGGITSFSLSAEL